MNSKLMHDPTIIAVNTTTMTEIYNFIKTFDREQFMHGQCYWFSVILFHRFRHKYNCRVLYNPIENHFACSISNHFSNYLCDAEGIKDFSYDEDNPAPWRDWTLWKTYVDYDPLDAARVYRDCIWHMDNEEWNNNLQACIRVAPWRFDKMFEIIE